MREQFADLEPGALHHEFVRTLKRTRNLAPLSDLVDQLPASLHAAALSIPVRRVDHGRLVEAVATTARCGDGLGVARCTIPIFAANSSELITIRETAALMAEAGFVPIIEPVKEALGGLEKTIKAI
ncbi:MAG: hypothetical protein WDN69_24645 [Aliidongia sp.]